VTNAVTELRLALRANDYDPVATVGKIPVQLEWQKKINLTPNEITQLGIQFPKATNTGASCERTPSLDADIHDPEAANAIRSAIEDWFGNDGDILFRTAAPRYSPRRFPAPGLSARSWRGRLNAWPLVTS
jgi:hypothetical protein